ncbi:unnamed protein product [Acanthoscelides obtectus]|uniref:MADF domain-containing protein n=1 Tax=Acanthoscelides obtectus TaxID=200917 RepID=A0A9P0L9H4_ACAOB|nr:unnamed protein product [Acanthoscelides obtectus]CAK1660008.1 hypothetical protein AOBTE_LOCUS21809 [Acanthoscelides obtectus]
MKWSEEETMRFVELYSEKECLWKKSSVNYRNKNMRKAAEEDIVNRMGKEGFGVTELKQKIKIMRTTYNQEALKVKKSKKSGGKPDDIYVPTVKWFRQMEEIMDSSTAENETESIETEIAPPSENEQGLLEEQVIEEPSPTLLQTPTRPSTSKTCSRVESTGKKGSRVEAGSKNKKPRLQALTEAVAEVRKAQETLITSQSISDNEAFGKFIAASLDKLPPADSIMAQGAPQRVIQKYRLNALNKSSSASEASALTAIQSPTLSRDSPPATTPAYSIDHPIMNEDTVANDDAAIADIISQAWNLTN